MSLVGQAPPPRPPSSTKPQRKCMEPSSTHTLILEDDGTDSQEVSEDPQQITTARPAKRQRIIFGTWVLGKQIGTGSSGTVKVVVHKDIGKKCVVKCIKRQIDVPNQLPAERNKDGIALREHFMLREALVGLTLDHPNIIKMHSYLTGKNHFYFFYEYLEGMDLADFISENGRMDESNALIVFRQIVSALAYMHASNVIHRDMKLENIRINPKTLKIHILDLGFSTFFSPKFKQHSSCGSPCYAPPEIYLHRPYRGPEVDVWSIGVCLFAITVGSLPFESTTFENLADLIVKSRLQMPSYLSPELQGLISRMLAIEPNLRISVSDISNSPWFMGTSMQLPISALQPTPSSKLFRNRGEALRSTVGATPGPSKPINIFSYMRAVISTSLPTTLPSPLSSAAAIAATAKALASPNFGLSWVEHVLRMERHARAEFLLRELQQRAGPRKWNLERAWQKESGLVPPVLDASTVVFVKSQPSSVEKNNKKPEPEMQRPVSPRKKTVAEIWARNVTQRRRDVVAARAPTPVRAIERVFRKAGAQRGAIAGTDTNVGASFWSAFKSRATGFGGEARCENASAQEQVSTVERIRRDWSTVPDFMDEAATPSTPTTTPAPLPPPPPPPPLPRAATSHLTLCDDSDTLDNEAATPSTIATPPPQLQKSTMSHALQKWWKTRFETDKTAKKPPKTASQCGGSGASESKSVTDLDLYTDSDDSDAESFQEIDLLKVRTRGSMRKN
ncbi:serine/threonine-protein kinase KIN2 [Chytriomyces hyalinus]|nr:serine/threonine-protein kinase KIN2 [Chytriomyces hyalinus]